MVVRGGGCDLIWLLGCRMFELHAMLLVGLFVGMSDAFPDDMDEHINTDCMSEMLVGHCRIVGLSGCRIVGH